MTGPSSSAVGVAVADLLPLHVAVERLGHIGPGIALVAHELGGRGQRGDAAVGVDPVDRAQQRRAGVEVGLLGQEARHLDVGLHALRAGGGRA